jgi:peptidoglycan/LPS O-acetylase OafA/YrhL
VKRIAILEGLRGWLACWVMISHIMLYCAISSSRLHSPFLHYLLAIPEAGRTPVWLFMILSGFVNFYLMDTRREPTRVYLTRRFLRLYPAFALLFLVSLPLNYLNLQALSGVTWSSNPWIKAQYDVTKSAFAYLGPNLAAHATLLHGLVPNWAWPHTSSAFLGVDWSISTEWQFYLLVPLLFWWALRRPSLLGMGLLACLCYFSETNKALRAFENDNPSLILFKFHLFFIGIASYQLYRQYVLKKIDRALSPAQWSVVGFLVAYLAGWDSAILLWAAIFLLTVLAEKNPADATIARLAWLFSNRWSQYLGTISYSIYLSHWLVLMAVLQVVYRLDPQITAPFAAVWLFPGVILATLLISHLLYTYVENPCIRFGKRLFNEE